MVDGDLIDTFYWYSGNDVINRDSDSNTTQFSSHSNHINLNNANRQNTCECIKQVIGSIEANRHGHDLNIWPVKTGTRGLNAVRSFRPVLGKSRLASSGMRGYMGAMQPDGGMPELLKRQIDRLETAIDLSTDWLEIQYLMVELDQLKALYEEEESEAA